MLDGNTNYPFIHKNKFYVDEREIRAFFEVALQARDLIGINKKFHLACIFDVISKA